MNEKDNPKIFISYSWTNSERVLELAERLMANGVEVIIDKWDLKEGQDKYAFMEQSVTDETVDKVLIICDKSYAEKANQRTGGVGDETAIISPEIYGRMRQEKFIPIVFEVDADGNPFLPAYIKSRIYINLSDDFNYESEFEKLLRNIYNKPLYRKPAIGTKPEWLENEKVELSSIRDLIKQTRGYTGGNSAKADFLMRKCADEFTNALMSYIPLDEKPYDEALLILIDEVKPLRDLFIDYIEALIYADLDVGSIIPMMIEEFYNTSRDSNEHKFNYKKLEFYDFFLWELFVCIIATLMHHGRYKELNKILNHTYFLRESTNSKRVKEFNFCKFRTYSRTIEEVCKPKSTNPKVHTLAGEILLKREKKPIITRESLATSDVVLFQLSLVFDLVNDEWDYYWLPLVYYAVDVPQPIWSKLLSKSYCTKIMPLFGVFSIEELKEKIGKCKIEREIRYSGSFESAPLILNSIKLDKIGTVA